MKSYSGSNTSLVNSFLTLTQNSSTSNNTLAGILINEQAKYLILKYFDNERVVTLTTSAATTATLTAIPAVGATSAVLTGTWPNVSAQQFVVFNGQQRNVNFIQNSTTIYWQSPLATASNTTAIATLGVQAYPLPANVSKIKNPTITVGQLVYSPAPVQSIQEWTRLNALPYSAQIPAYFFLYDGVLNFWPTPSTTGDVITLNCQIKVPDMTYSDYTTGTIATMTVGQNTVTGSGTSWTSSFPTITDLTFANLYLTVTPPNGDGTPYKIQNFTDNTHLTLTSQVMSPITSGASYTIGQYPLLSSDFHDAILYGALRVYYSSIVPDATRYQLYNGLHAERLQQMELYLANKQVNVDLSTTPPAINPNLFIYPTS